MIEVFAQSVVALVLWVAGFVLIVAAFGPKVKTATNVQMGVARFLLAAVSLLLYFGAWTLTASVFAV